MNIRKLKMKLIVIMVALFATIYNIPVYADEIEVNTVEEYTEPVINGIVVEVENNEEEIVLEQQDSQEEPVEVVEEDSTYLQTTEETETTAEEEIIEVAVENPVEEETITEQESIELVDEIEITDEQVEESSKIVEEELTEEATTGQESLEAAEELQAEETSGYSNLKKGDSAWTFTSSKGQLVSLVIDPEKSTVDGAATGSNNYRTFTFTVGEGEDAVIYSSYIYGDGINDDSCVTFADAYLTSLTSDGNGKVTVTDKNAVDANKSSVLWKGDNGDQYYIITKNDGTEYLKYKDENGYFKIDENGNKVYADPEEFDYNSAYVAYNFNYGVGSEHCWIKAGSDMVEQSGWIQYANLGIFGDASKYFEDEDDIGDYISYCFSDYPGYTQDVFSWLFKGTVLNDNSIFKYGYDTNDAILSEYYQYLTYGIYVGGSDANNPNNQIEAMNAAFNDLMQEHDAESLGIYFYDTSLNYKGGHAVNLNGMFYDTSNNNLVAVIIADPDDSVFHGPEGASTKPKNYIVTSIRTDKVGNYFYYDLNNYQSNRITILGDVCAIWNSNEIVTTVDGVTKLKEINKSGTVTENLLPLNQSIVPTSTSAIRTALPTGTVYDICDSFNIGLNYDFLSFYDIDDIKYELSDNSGNVVQTGILDYSKSTWQSLLNSSDDFNIDFTNIISSIGEGTYNLKLTIDKDCFYGNYRWFAEKDNYADELVNILVNMYHKQVNNYSYDDTPIEVTISQDKDTKDLIIVVSPTETLINNEDGTTSRVISNANNSNVQVKANSTIIPTGTSFDQSKVDENSKEYQTIQQALQDNESISNYFAYNFDLTKEDGTQIHELDGYVEVSLPIPEDITLADNQTLNTYLVNEDGTLTKCETSIKDGIITFKTNHFSTYLFTIEDHVVQEPLASNVEVTTSTSNYMLPGTIGCGLLVVVFLIVMNKKKK